MRTASVLATKSGAVPGACDTISVIGRDGQDWASAKDEKASSTAATADRDGRDDNGRMIVSTALFPKFDVLVQTGRCERSEAIVPTPAERVKMAKAGQPVWFLPVRLG
jgi:hypothetical protein